jgi:hypothetical protein
MGDASERDGEGRTREAKPKIMRDQGTPSKGNAFWALNSWEAHFSGPYETLKMESAI